MERLSDDLICLQWKRPRWNWRAGAPAWTLRLAESLAIGVVIGVGLAVGIVLAR